VTSTSNVKSPVLYIDLTRLGPSEFFINQAVMPRAASRWRSRHVLASTEANIRLEANYAFRWTDTASGRLRRSRKLTACMD